MQYMVSVSDLARVVESSVALKVLSEDENFCCKLSRNPNLSGELWYKVLGACERGLYYEGIANLAFTAKRRSR